MELNNLFKRVSEQFENEFDKSAKEIRHPGESGKAREQALRKLLEKYLPQRAGVDQGFVIDAQGRKSKQIDMVVYDKTLATVFEFSSVRYFPCEIVLAVGEVKSKIDSKSKLEDALDKIRSVKALDRSNRGKNLPVTGPGISLKGFEFDPFTQHRDQILGFIFTSKSMTKESVLETLQEYNSKHERRLWLNIFCAYRHYLISYESGEVLTPSAMNAQRMYCTAENETPHLLLLFLSILASFVNEAHVARPNYFDYATILTTKHTDHPLMKKGYDNRSV